MSKTPSMPLFCGDYLGDTKHLSIDEHGAYLMLLMVMWQNAGQPLPDDPARMARILGISVTRWQDKIRPVLAPFFDLSEGAWASKRLQKEWNFVQERSANSRENGKHGGRPKTLKSKDTQNPEGSSRVSVQVTQTESTPPNPSSTEVPNGTSSADAPLDLKAVVFGQVRLWLEGTSGRSEAAVRRWLGQCCRDYGDGNVVMAAASIRAGPAPVDPFSRMVDELKRMAGGRNGKHPRQSAEDKSRKLAEGMASALMALGVECGPPGPGPSFADCAGYQGSGIVIDADAPEGFGGHAGADARALRLAG